MPEPLGTRTAKMQGLLTLLAFPLLGFGGLALGLELGSAAAGVAGMLLLPGFLAVYLATRRPPMDPPAPNRES